MESRSQPDKFIIAEFEVRAQDLLIDQSSTFVDYEEGIVRVGVLHLVVLRLVH
jgi:hypothetical protein